MIARLELNNFTVFDQLEIDFSKKINVIIGENGTGKTHLLKAAYAVSLAGHLFKLNPEADRDELKAFLTEKLVRLFMPLDDKLGKIVRTGTSKQTAELKAEFALDEQIQLSFSYNSQTVAIQNAHNYRNHNQEPIFITTKEVLSFMEGFNSLYERYKISFDQTYKDVCLSLDLPQLRERKVHPKAEEAMEDIRKLCGGQFVFHGGGKVTFKSDKNVEYSANAMAEGFRKLGMLSRLLEAGVIEPGISGSLFWDEPESNINPQMIRLLVKILLDLSRNGQQIILATHDYVLLKWLDLLSDEKEGDQVRFHSLYRDPKSSEIMIESCDQYYQINQNSISDSFAELYDADISRALA
ncbi:MAG: AAA family ATPase [Cyanobacteria bacterium J06560_6]